MHFTDLEVQTGAKKVRMRFFLTDLGEQKIILGYPWFAAMQPRVDWACAWIDYEQLPVVLRTPDAHKAIFTPAKNRLSKVKASFKNLAKRLWKIQSEDWMFVTRVYVEPWIMSASHQQTQASKLAEQEQSTKKATPLPEHYQRHTHIFSEQEAQRFLGPWLWDHAIELKKDAPATLPVKIYTLTQDKQKALQEFIKEHVEKGYIRLSKSPYTAPFLFIKKKVRMKMDNFDLFKTTDDWTNGPYTINIFFHLSANSFCASKKHLCSLNSTYTGDTTMYALKRATNGKPCSSQIKAYSNQESCSSVLQTPQPHSKPWWMPYLQKNYVKIG